MKKTTEINKIQKAAEYIKDKIIEFCNINKIQNFIPEYFVILGSGLGHYADSENVEHLFSLSYNEIPNFPTSTVQGHKGRLVFGKVENVYVLFMQGRFHYYEGYELCDVVLPIRVAAFMGIKKLIVTNAAGGVNEDFEPGDLMIITDHISTFVPSPLRGKNVELGTRFPDMSKAYCDDMIEIAEKIADKRNIKLKKGVYLQTSGPQYETPAEVRMIRILGADAVGMSTACEVIAANHAGMKVFGMSCITNMASGIQKEPLSHEEVQKTADLAEKCFAEIITDLITTYN